MIKAIIISLVLIAAAPLAHGGVIYRVENGAIKVGPKNTPIESVSPEDRDEVLRQVRMQLNDPKTVSSAAKALLALRDKPTIEHLVGEYHKDSDVKTGCGINRAATLIQDYGNESVISYLVSDVCDNEGAKLSNEIKYKSSTIILNVIRRAEGFPVRTREWADNLYWELIRHMGLVFPQVAKQIQEWWNHNNGAVLAGECDKAIWLPKEKLNYDFLKHLRENPPPPPTPPPAR